jgi:hypothetical protein
MAVSDPTGARPAAPAEPTVRRPTDASWIMRHRGLLAIVALGAAVRFATLTQQSFWLDEAQAAHELSLGWGAMLDAWNRAEWNPPLYLLIGWPWARLFGTGEASLHTLSALFGIALIPVVYAAGAELVTRRAGLWAAALAALNPFMIWYSQEAREYALLTLLSAISLWCFARAWSAGPGSGGRRALIAWTAISVLALLTQYFAAFLVLPEGLLLIWRLRSRTSVAALGLQGVALAAFLPHVQPQLGSDATFITSQPLWLRIQQVPATFVLNTLAQSSLVHWGVAGGVVAVAIAGGLLLAVGDPQEVSGAALATALAAVVILLPLVMALVWHDDFIARGLMPAWPPLAIAFGAACGARAAPAAGAALGAVLLGLFAWAGIRIDTDQTFQRPDWRGVAAALGRGPAGPGARAVVVYPGSFGAGPLSLLLPGTPWAGPGGHGAAPGTPQTVSEVDIVANAGAEPLSREGTARLIARRTVDGYLVLRYRLAAPSPTDAADLMAFTAAALRGTTVVPTVLIQPPPSLS